MFKKLKEFDSRYYNLFFCIALLIIIIILVYISTSTRQNMKTCTTPNDIIKDYTSYSYNIRFTDQERKIDLFIKRYNSKYLIEKNENGSKTMYYLHYTDLLEKSSDGTYIKYRKNEIIDGIDNKYLILDYINEVSLDSNINNESDLTCYINRKLEIKMCVNLDDSIELKGDNYSLTYKINEVGNISDFNVEISHINDIDNSLSSDEIFTE